MTSPTPVYDIGDSRRFSAAFTDMAGTVADPSSVVVEIHAPDGVITDLVYGDAAAVVRESAGQYYVDVAFTKKGRHQIRFVGDGDLISAEMLEVFIRG